MEVRVILHVFPSMVKGRTYPVCVGYRPDWRFPWNYSHPGSSEKSPDNNLHGAMVLSEGASFPLNPEFNGQFLLDQGQVGRVVLHPYDIQAWECLKQGQQLLMYEGSRCVGVALIEEIKN